MADPIDSKPYRVIINFSSIDEALSDGVKFARLLNLFMSLYIPTDQPPPIRLHVDGVVLGFDDEILYHKLLQCNDKEYDIKNYDGISLKPK
jgi:hypothetical protein